MTTKEKIKNIIVSPKGLISLSLAILITISLLVIIPNQKTDSSKSSEGSETQNTENVINVLPPLAFNEKIDEYKAKNKDFVILDVRTPKEYEQGYIQDATLMNFYDPDFKQKLSQLDKNKTYFVYCRSGARSGKVVQMMKGMGFTEIYELKGGIISWTQNNLPLIK